MGAKSGRSSNIAHLYITAPDVAVGVFPVDAFWVKRVFNGLERVPTVVTILGTTGTTPEEALVIVKGAGGYHAGADGIANGAAV